MRSSIFYLEKLHKQLLLWMGISLLLQGVIAAPGTNVLSDASFIRTFFRGEQNYGNVEQASKWHSVNSSAHPSQSKEKRRLFDFGRTFRTDLLIDPVFVKQDWGGLTGLDSDIIANSGKFIFAAIGEFWNNFALIDIRNLTNPHVLLTVKIGDEGDQLQDGDLSADDTIFAAGFVDKILLFKIDLDNAQVSEVGRVENIKPYSYSHEFTFSKDNQILYHTLENSLYLARIDISDISSPKYISDVGMPNPDGSSIRKYLISDDGTLFFTKMKEGLQIANISDPEDATQVARLFTGFHNRFMKLSHDQNTVFLTDSINGLIIVDVTDRKNPAILSEINISKLFSEVQFRLMDMSDDGSILYLNTYDGFQMVAGIQDLRAPKIEAILNVGRRFRFLHDYKWGLQLYNNKYELFDISKIYLREDEVVPNLAKEHRPIMFREVNLDKAKPLNRQWSQLEYYDQHDLIVYSDQPIQGSPELQFYNTSSSILHPEFISQCIIPLNDSLKVYSKLEVDGALTRVFLVTHLFYQNEYEFHVVDIKNLSEPVLQSQRPLNYSTDDYQLRPMTNIVHDSHRDVVFMGFQKDEIVALDVSQKTPKVSGQTSPAEDLDRLYQLLVLREDDEGRGRLLFVLTSNSLLLYNVTSYFNYMSKMTLPAVGKSLSFESSQTILVAGDYQGIYRINMEAQPSGGLTLQNYTMAFSNPSSDVEFFQIQKHGLTTASSSQMTYYDTTRGGYDEVSSVSADTIKSLQSIKQSEAFFCKTFHLSSELKPQVTTSYIPGVLFIDTNQAQPLQLGDSFKTLDLYPMSLKEKIGYSSVYSDLWEEHRFLELKNFIKYDDGIVSAPFPKWVTVDPVNSRLLLELNTPFALGTHYVYARLSRKVPDDAFVGLKGISNGLESFTLKQDLIRMGHIDTSSFNTLQDGSTRLQMLSTYSQDEGLLSVEKIVAMSNQDMLTSLIGVGSLIPANDTHIRLNPDFSDYVLYIQAKYLGLGTDVYSALAAYFTKTREDMLEFQVKEVLQSYYLDVVGEFTIVESLKVTFESYIGIMTKSLNLIKTTLEFEDPMCGTFANDGLGDILHNGNKFVIEGNSIDMNEAMKSLRIDITEPSDTCSMKLSIDDLLNPIYDSVIGDAATVMKINQKPIFARKVQIQFEEKYVASSVPYDSHFEFLPEVENEVGEELSFLLEFRSSSGGWVPADSLSWVLYDEKTGKISGTPKKEVVFNSFNFRITVKDPFKSSTDEFHIRIRPTGAYFVEMAIQLGSGFFFIVGTWKYRDEIYTALCKKKYQYKRYERALVNQDFVIEIPIIRLELQELNPMISHMKKSADQKWKEKRKRFGEIKPRLWIDLYFDDENNFDFSSFFADLNSLDEVSEEVQQEAMKQFSFLICHHLYDAPPSEVEAQVISLFAEDVKDEPLWAVLRQIIFEVVQAINQNKLQTPIVAFSEYINKVYGFKTKAIQPHPLGKVIFSVQQFLSFHLARLPLPTAMPVWLRCELDANYIILSGVPRVENRDEETFIRIYDIFHFIIREFRIIVEDRDDESTVQKSLGQSQVEMIRRGTVQSFSRQFTTAFKEKMNTLAKSNFKGHDFPSESSINSSFDSLQKHEQ